jgi:hypothetical protein
MTTEREQRVDWHRPYEWPRGQLWNDATHIRQDGVVFKWDEIMIRYRPTADDTSQIEWRNA